MPGANVELIFSAFVLALVPLLVVGATSFTKISCVLLIVRNAIGIQQVPPNVIVYALALVLSMLVMSPTAVKTWESIKELGVENTAEVVEKLPEIGEPLRQFLQANAKEKQVDFFYQKHVEIMHRKSADPLLDKQSFAILLPAFLVSELTSALLIGFILYLPLLLIDMIVAVLLQAMGMNMMSPSVFALPVKLILFIAVDGWGRLIDLLIGAYH